MTIFECEIQLYHGLGRMYYYLKGRNFRGNDDISKFMSREIFHDQFYRISSISQILNRGLEPSWGEKFTATAIFVLISLAFSSDYQAKDEEMVHWHCGSSLFYINLIKITDRLFIFNDKYSNCNAVMQKLFYLCDITGEKEHLEFNLIKYHPI